MSSPGTTTGPPPGPAAAGGSVQHAEATLRAQGQRVTEGRRAVIRALDHLGGHPTASEVEAAVTELSPGIHRATVYRTLETLAALDVVSHVHMSHGTAYHLAGRTPARAHLHARCRVCGTVVDLPPDLLDGVTDHVDALADFELDPSHVALSGLCTGCRSRR